MNGWDRKFIEMAVLVSSWSKDPSTKVGCVIADSDHAQLSEGFNGFPRGIADDERLHQRPRTVAGACRQRRINRVTPWRLTLALPELRDDEWLAQTDVLATGR